MIYPGLYEEQQSHEWECRACGCLNDNDSEACWNCNAGTDGEDSDPPKLAKHYD